MTANALGIGVVFFFLAKAVCARLLRLSINADRVSPGCGRTELLSRLAVDVSNEDAGQSARCVMPYLFWMVLPFAWWDTFAGPPTEQDERKC